MAEKLSLEELSLEQLEREVTCGICQEYYTEPKVLPCLHYYCKQCILKLALRTGTDEPFSCPECRSEAFLPEGGVDELKSAFFIGRFKSIFSTMERAKGKVEVKCEACTSGATAESFCRQCAMFICNTCVNAHQTMNTIFRGHKIVSLQDLKEGRAKVDITVKEASSPLKCLIHDKELKVYCFHCDTLICRDCTVVDHRDHTFQFSAVAAPEMKEELMKELEPLRQVGDGLSRAVEEVKSTRHEVEAQGESVAQTINTSFDELLQVVEKRRQELLEEAGRRVQEKVSKLSVQEKTLSLASAGVQSVVDYTERCVKHCEGNEVMSMHTEIRRQIEHVIEEYNKPVRSMEPAEEVDMGVEVRCAEDLQQLCQTKAKITQLPVDVAQCTLKGEGLKTVEVNQKAEVTLTANILTNGKPTTRSVSVDCYLKSNFNGFVTECDVDQSGPGEYRIQFTPSVRGRHGLIVLVDKQQVPGSPFFVFVSIHPLLLGKPVSILYNDDGDIFCDVNINSSGEIIVGKQYGGILSFYKDEKLLRTIGRNMLQLDDYTVVGVAVDDENYVYFTLFKSSTLVKMDKGGNIVKKTQSRQNTGNMGLAVTGEEVMVCPCLYSGTIMVYDRELAYVRKIVGEGMGEFRDISPDSLGNLFVSDWEMQCIRVFSRGGDTLRSFGFQVSGKNLMIKLRGIAVAGQFVYVCVEGGVLYDNSVQVFTTAGEHVTTIGHIGFYEGEFVTPPYAVCVDRDGFVHVGDTTKVQTF